MLRHRHRHAAPHPCLTALAPYRAGLVVAVEALLTWAGLAAWGAAQGMAFGRGHALSRHARPGGPAHQDQSAAPHMAAQRRAGQRPQASGSPAARRATRARLRRRPPLRRPRAALWAPGHQPPAPYPWPALGKPSASKAPREGVAARWPARAVQTHIAGARPVLP